MRLLSKITFSWIFEPCKEFHVEVISRLMNAITFEGIDSAGKSSLSCTLSSDLQEMGFRVTYLARSTSCARQEDSWSDGYLEGVMSSLAGTIWEAPQPERHHELGHGYWLGLVSAYFSCLAETVIPAAAERSHIVIVENWCHKFAARLELRGVPLQRLQHALPLDAPFARTFLLDTSPEIAWERNAEPSLLEMGAQDGYQPLGRDSFVAYQSRLREKLLHQAGARGWDVINNDGPPDTARKELLRRVVAFLERETAHA